METIKLKVRIGPDGILKIETPTQLRDIETEVVVVLQTATVEPLDANGYPPDYFEAIDAIQADDLIERPEQPSLDVREPFE
ncbi:MAG: hypothetical protein AAF125_00030 [Chloroflexota bacterium]